METAGGYGASNCSYGHGEGTTRYGVAGYGELVWAAPPKTAKAEALEAAPEGWELELQLQEVL